MRIRRLMCVLLLFTLWLAEAAEADWRWAKPHFKKQMIAFVCDTAQCIHTGYDRVRTVRRWKVHLYNVRRLREWKYWTHLYIPDCTWYGESGLGPKYARYRYTMPNSQGSGAFGKFQFKANTYHANAKYHDWSPLDQEIAARREYWKHGTSPWANC